LNPGSLSRESGALPLSHRTLIAQFVATVVLTNIIEPSLSRNKLTSRHQHNCFY